MAMKKSFFYLIFLFSILIFWNNNCISDPFVDNPKIEKIEIIKSAKVLRTYQKTASGWKMLKEYSISLGYNPKGSKEQQGDGKTPEGNYFISGKNPNSAYYLSLEISYPNEEDKRKAKQKKLLPGNHIMIHGILNGLGWLGKVHLLKNWTKGCIALTNEEMKEIYHHTEIGTPVVIKP